MTSSDGLEAIQRGRTLCLTIHRPQAKNAIDEPLARALEAALERASADLAIHSVLLGATGDVFLSGGDLRALGRLPNDAQGADAVIGLGLRVAAIERCAVPVVAAVEGPVYGGGCELLLMTDVSVLDERATLHFVHRKMGLVPAWGGCTRLAERVGAARAAAALFSASPISATAAADMGLVSRVAAPGTARTVAEAVTTQLAAAPRASLTAIKRSLVAVREAARGASFERERESFRAAWGSEPHRAAMARFLSR